MQKWGRLWDLWRIVRDFGHSLGRSFVFFFLLGPHIRILGLSIPIWEECGASPWPPTNTPGWWGKLRVSGFDMSNKGELPYDPCDSHVAPILPSEATEHMYYMLQNLIFAAHLCKQVARLSTPVFYYMGIYHIIWYVMIMLCNVMLCNVLLINIKIVPRTLGQDEGVGKCGSLWKKLYRANH